MNDLSNQHIKNGALMQSLQEQDHNSAAAFFQNFTAFIEALSGSHLPSNTTLLPNITMEDYENMFLRCMECGVGKVSSEELENHIKTEHLSWFPFECPVCGAKRATSLLMREHVYSVHRMKHFSYIYNDDPVAQRTLRMLLDHSILNNERTKCHPSIEIPIENERKEILPIKDNDDIIEAKAENDNTLQNVSDGSTNNVINSMNIFGNFETLLSGVERQVALDAKKLPKGVTKKRVIGICSSCKKPVTAGSRQVHIFYHLAKDQQKFRFRCLYDGCDVAHYRKDQLEAHQTKIHGVTAPELMKDCTQELAVICNDLSLELLGTISNAPGPTAEEGQKLFNEMQEEAMQQMNNKKIRKRKNSNAPKFVLNSMSTTPDNLQKDNKELDDHVPLIKKEYVVEES
uniref:C2H2-type domain-containing protein n=1 Tax=Parastrongyloides trichosuri TaxID=131310 RepID=A0A0N4ZR33_PARTI